MRIEPKPHDEYFAWEATVSRGKYAHNRGRAITERYEQLLREQRDALPVLTRCLFCPWFHQGTLAEGREAHAQHRAEHPGAAKTATQPRKTARHQMIPDTDIRANIARARAQGAHRWDEAA